MTTEQDWTQDPASVYDALMFARQGIIHEIEFVGGKSGPVQRLLAEALQKFDPVFRVIPNPSDPSLCYLTRGAL